MQTSCEFELALPIALVLQKNRLTKYARTRSKKKEYFENT